MQKYCSRKKEIICLTMIVVLMLALSYSCLASSLQQSSNYSFSSSLDGGQTAFNFTGYLYYTDNTSSSITVDKMGFSLKNTGTNDVTSAVFNAFNGNGTGNNNATSGDYVTYSITAIEPGELVLHTSSSWSSLTGVSATYQKNNASAYFEMEAGNYMSYGGAQISCNTSLKFTSKKI